MDILIILYWAFFLCLFVSVIIITFPASYSHESSKFGSRRIQLISLIADIAVCVMILILRTVFHLAICFIDAKISIMLIPVVACLVFSISLYYPSVRFLSQKNLNDQETINRLLRCIFKCAYSDKSGSMEALVELAKMRDDEDLFIVQYGLSVYLNEYAIQSEYNANSKPPENIIHFVLDMLAKVKHDIDNYTPSPFPNIGLVLSFIFSTLLTALLSIITVV